MRELVMILRPFVVTYLFMLGTELIGRGLQMRADQRFIQDVRSHKRVFRHA